MPQLPEFDLLPGETIMWSGIARHRSNWHIDSTGTGCLTAVGALIFLFGAITVVVLSIVILTSPMTALPVCAAGLLAMVFGGVSGIAFVGGIFVLSPYWFSRFTNNSAYFLTNQRAVIMIRKGRFNQIVSLTSRDIARSSLIPLKDDVADVRFTLTCSNRSFSTQFTAVKSTPDLQEIVSRPLMLPKPNRDVSEARTQMILAGPGPDDLEDDEFCIWSGKPDFKGLIAWREDRPWVRTCVGMFFGLSFPVGLTFVALGTLLPALDPNPFLPLVSCMLALPMVALVFKLVDILKDQEVRRLTERLSYYITNKRIIIQDGSRSRSFYADQIHFIARTEDKKTRTGDIVFSQVVHPGDEGSTYENISLQAVPDSAEVEQIIIRQFKIE